MGRKIVGFLIGLAIVAVAFSFIAVYSKKGRVPTRAEPEVAQPVKVAPEPEVSEPVREPAPLRTPEPPEIIEKAPSTVPQSTTVAPVQPPAVTAKPEPVKQPVEEPPAVVAVPAPQPAPVRTDRPQRKLAEPVQQAPLKKPEVLTEAPPEPQPVPPVPNPPLKVAKADPVPEPVSEAQPASPAAKELEPAPEAATVQEPVPAEDAAKETVTTPVIRRSRLPVVSDDTNRSAGIQFGRPNTSSLPSVTEPEAGAVPAVPDPALPPEAPAPVSPKRLVAPKSAQSDTDKVAILTLEPEAQQAPERIRAIDKFGVLFDAGEKPTMSIILVDVGNAGVTLNTAATLDLPVTFAVAVDRADASLAARSYFSNGHEVLALSPRSVELSLSGGQSEEQVADLLKEFFRIVPQSVGLLDVPEATLQNDRVLSNHVLAALLPTGHGLVTYEQGLNVVKREADKTGVPAGLIFRDLDQKGESEEAIQRHLDRAATEASRVGHVLVIGSTRAGTIEAIKAWSQSRTARNVALAPVSASIKQD